MYLKLLEKQEQTKPKPERNNKDQGQDQWDQDQRIMQRINETKSWFFKILTRSTNP
jgi:hypothetical protein